jgi:Family of unknown function (DUF5519)
MDKTAQQQITDEVTSWPEVEVGPGRFGSVRFAIGNRELGHLHGDHLADLPLTRALRDRLMEEGEVVRHRPLPDSGWASRHIDSEEDVQAVIDLLRMQYERALAARGRRVAA